jgi:glycosyltransferase involved in cell wall biosynthesis
MTKNILIFSLAYYPYVGGAEVAIKEITDRLPEYSFDLVTLRFNKNLPKEERMGNVSIYRIGFGSDNPSSMDMVSFPLYLNKILFPVTAFLKGRSLHKKKRYDLIWSVITYAGFPAVLFKLFYSDVPYILTIQDGDPIPHITNRRRIKVVYPIFKRIFTRADKIQVISNHLGEFAKRMGAKAKIKVIPNGVDVGLFTKDISSKLKQNARNDIDRRAQDKFLIHFGRFVEKNGLEDVILSLRYLENYVKLILIGEGPLLNELKNLTRKESLEDRVIFLEFKSHEEILPYLAISDIFIRPSLSEGFGNVFVEAMAAKIPVIGTNVDGIKDFLKDGETGWVCAVRDPKSIASKVKFILDGSNHKEVARVVNTGHTMVMRRYDWSFIAREMKQLFEGAL